MGLGTVLQTATSGLRATNRELEVVSSNITNANTPGYTKKTTNRQGMVINGQLTSVFNTRTQRAVDAAVQRQYWTELGDTGYIDTLSSYLGQIDSAFGTPGEANALDALINTFSESLQALQTSPDDPATQWNVLNDAYVLTQRMNSVAGTIQDLRQDADLQLGIRSLLSIVF